MLKSLSIRKAFAAFGASSALVCCVVLNLAIGNANLPLQIALSALLLAGGGVTGILIGRFYGQRAEVIVGGLNALAKGHLDCRLDLDGRDDFAWLCYEYNAARKAVKKLVEHLQALSGTLTSAAVELSEHSGSARENGARQLDSIRAVGSAIEQMSGNIRDIESLSRGLAAGSCGKRRRRWRAHRQGCQRQRAAKRRQRDADQGSQGQGQLDHPQAGHQDQGHPHRRW